MTLPDEPLFPADAAASSPEIREETESRVRRLVEDQPFAVLCTQGQGQPYGSLVAYAMTDDLASAVFATPKATRKFRLLSQCDHVALLIDNRPHAPREIMRIEAVTATGRATLVDEKDEHARWASLLTSRHPYLERFVRSDSCGLFHIHIFRYFHVCHFQEVRQWVPTNRG